MLKSNSFFLEKNWEFIHLRQEQTKKINQTPFLEKLKNPYTEYKNKQRKSNLNSNYKKSKNPNKIVKIHHLPNWSWRSETTERFASAGSIRQQIFPKNDLRNTLPLQSELEDFSEKDKKKIDVACIFCLLYIRKNIRKIRKNVRGAYALFKHKEAESESIKPYGC